MEMVVMPKRGAALIAGNAGTPKTAGTDIVDETAQFVAQFEGLKLEPYFDPAGIMTIGYGHQLSPTKYADWESWSLKKQADTLNAEMGKWKIANPNLANLVDGSGNIRSDEAAWGLLRRDVEKTMGLMLVDLGPKVIDRMTRNQKVAVISLFYNSVGVTGGAKKVFPNLLRILKDGRMPDGSIATAKQLAQEWGGGKATKDQSAGVVHAGGEYSKGIHDRKLVELERFFVGDAARSGRPDSAALAEWFSAEWKIRTAPAELGGKVGQRTLRNTEIHGREGWNKTPNLGGGVEKTFSDRFPSTPLYQGVVPSPPSRNPFGREGHSEGELVKKARLIKPQPPVPQPPARKGASLLRDPDKRMASSGRTALPHSARKGASLLRDPDQRMASLGRMAHMNRRLTPQATPAAPSQATSAAPSTVSPSIASKSSTS
jgi:GH24 family phage-related lysozyme (muramidase)